MSGKEVSFSDLTASPVSSNFYSARGKRAIDIVLSLFVLPFALPTLFLLSLLIVIAGKKPFYGQDMVGRNGRAFRMRKLYSGLNAVGTSGRRDGDLCTKRATESRLETLYELLRRSSLDELPQLYNVLAGDMSFLGPRAISMADAAIRDGADYGDLRPGIAGPWLVAAPAHAPPAEQAPRDTQYAGSVTFTSDLRLLATLVKQACTAS
ncbi:MAG: sugar transferase [Jannaschia sp.]